VFVSSFAGTGIFIIFICDYLPAPCLVYEGGWFFRVYNRTGYPQATVFIVYSYIFSV